MSDLIYLDRIIFSPDDIKEEFKSVDKDIAQKTEIIGTFNPGMTKLPNGNILLMVRVAEALKEWKTKESILSPRFDVKSNKFVIDTYPIKKVTLNDPRLFLIRQENGITALRLTSLSWLLPVELNPDDMKVVEVHHDKKIVPTRMIEEMGLEDPRITLIDNHYYMTVVSVSSNRISTSLYISEDGISYRFKDIIFEHQNKDIVLFPEKIDGKYHALTRPEGNNISIGYPHQEEYLAGPFISSASSLDLIHWKPCEDIIKPLEKQNMYTTRIGPGAPPITHEYNGRKYFLELFHGVERSRINSIGKYRTFAMLLNKENPNKIRAISKQPVLQSSNDLKNQIQGNLLIDEDVVFTTGIVLNNNNNDSYIIASGELDTATRITVVSREYINSFFNKEK